ncbi:MAG TPA: hydrogenase maturation protease [Sumerlaeia bacterium]|nr:hydrogenase maturation protease [Sumerlaeia bacterium]
MKTRESSTGSILILGYGNPGRQDDGLGPAFAESLGSLGRPGVSVDSNYQLNVEDAASVARHDRVLFVDACRQGEAPFVISGVSPVREIAFTTHAVSPRAVLALCEDCFGARPEAWVLGIRGYEFGVVEGLTRRARGNLEKALGFVGELIGQWKEKEHGDGQRP